MRNKLFWFGDYQGTYRRVGASESVRVPTAAERMGNLSDLGVPIYDPATGSSGGTGRSLFAGGDSDQPDLCAGGAIAGGAPAAEPHAR